MCGMLRVVLLVLGIACQTARGQTECGKQDIANTPGNGFLSKIVGGTIAVDGSWPWQVQLKAYGQHSCGGSIINSEWILTAAHCFNQYSFTSAWMVHAGSWRSGAIDSTESSHRVARIIRHTYYSPWGQDYDIAVMKLSTPITFTTHRKPVCLPSVQDTLQYGTNCYVTGWGETSSTGYAGYLKQTMIPILNPTVCMMGHPGQITAGMICAGHTNTNIHRPCYGDSGGPMVCERSGVWYQFGVVSWGDEFCNNPNQPPVFSSMLAYANWIQSAIRS